MKIQSKPKRRSSRARRGPSVAASTAAGAAKPETSETFTAMETGRPDRDEGRGPLGQEGEGEAQNDQLAALEGTEPEASEVEI